MKATNPTPLAVLDDVGPAPCLGCHFEVQCRGRLLACHQFGDYVNRNRWTEGARSPSREIYDRVFAADDDLKAAAGVGAKPKPQRATRAATRSRSKYVQRVLAALAREATPFFNRTEERSNAD